jgi:hypothetical protein
MVRSPVSVTRSLRYRAAAMSADTGAVDRSTPPAQAWTPEAAMEPVLPLAPPPARPGAGRAVVTPPRPSVPGSGLRVLLRLAMVVAVIAGLVVLVLVFGH